MLYTDGLVETAKRDIGLGIDRLIGQAETAAPRRLRRGASTRLVEGSGRRTTTGPCCASTAADRRRRDRRTPIGAVRAPVAPCTARATHPCFGTVSARADVAQW